MLPGLTPQHTRQSFCSGSRLYVEKVIESPDDFLRTPEGLWLLPPSVAERDRVAGIARMGELAANQDELGLDDLAAVSDFAWYTLTQTEVTDDGCMVEGLDKESPLTSGELVLYLAEQEWGSPVLDEAEDTPYLQVCDTESCYNTRHFDLDFARLSLRKRMTELNPLWYQVNAAGEVRTLWDDELATLDESMHAYIKMQKMNFPHVPFKDSPLTPSGVSQVSFHPLTGCWETWSYSVKPDGSKGGRFEGYGNLYFRHRPETVDRQTGEIIPAKRRGHWLAHRTMWEVMGNQVDRDKVLNHLCNYKRCCNPLHLEQITEDENKVHGRNAREYIRELEHEDPTARDYFLGAEAIAGLQERARELYMSLAQ